MAVNDTSGAPKGSGSRESNDAAEMRLGYRMMGVAFQASSEVAAGAGIGWFIDWLRGGTNSLGLIIGGACGVILSMYTLIRQGLKVSNQLDAMEKRRRSGR